MNAMRSAYDEIPYTSHVFPQSHPTRLAAVAKLFGLDSPPVDNCRVLELGCSMGGNLIGMAQNHPGSRFMGIDSSSRQIATGWRYVNQLGLKNIRLQHLDILDVDEDFGEFDYIVAHGIYSWVPLTVQTQMLELIRRHLAPKGVAYISYNTFPGWHIRGIVREMMLYRGLQFKDPDTQLAQAKSLVEFVARSTGSEQDPYRQLLQRELQSLDHSDDYYLHHEHLEENNHPVYFHEFARQLGVNGLQYLGDADVSNMITTNFGPDAARTLHELGAHDIVQCEQYMDFVRCRYFRESLVCHSAIHLNRQLRPAVVRDLWLASQAAPESASSAPMNHETETFRLADGRGISCCSPQIKSALRTLLQRWPASVSFAELYANSQSEIPGNGSGDGSSSEDFLAAELLACIAAGVVEWQVAPAPFTTEVDECPRVTPGVRFQAKQGDTVFNMRGEAIQLDALHLRLLEHLDGTRNAPQLTEILLAHVQQGGHELRRNDGTVVHDPEEMRTLLGAAVLQALNNLAQHALLARQSSQN